MIHRLPVWALESLRYLVGAPPPCVELREYLPPRMRDPSRVPKSADASQVAGMDSGIRCNNGQDGLEYLGFGWGCFHNSMISE